MEQHVIAVALSGGGHRASAWALGVLQAIVDADLGGQLTSITSVSGGSITNAVVADRVDLHHAARSDLDAATADLRRTISSEGLVFPGPRTKSYTCSLIGGCSALIVGLVTIATMIAIVDRDLAQWWPFLLTTFTFSLVASMCLLRNVPRAGCWLLYITLLLVSGIGLGRIISLVVHGSSAVATTLVLIGVELFGIRQLLELLARRGEVATQALDDTYFAKRQLKDLGPGHQAPAVNHILVATDLESADAVYLEPRFVSSFRRGISSADGISIAQATQASAALPGAFPPSFLHLDHPFRRAWGSGVNPDRRIVPASDGGTYDNMADQWDMRRAQRVSEWAGAAPRGLGPAPTLLIVANASTRWTWRPWAASNWLVGELTAIRRSQGVQYDQSTATRRAALFQRFNDGIRGNGDLCGLLLMIDSDPFNVCDTHACDKDAAIAARARAARSELASLGGCKDTTCCHDTALCSVRSAWRQVAEHNCAVPTTLGPIGQATVDSLLAHSRCMTTTYLYVLHGLGSPALLEEPPSLQSL